MSFRLVANRSVFIGLTVSVLLGTVLASTAVAQRIPKLGSIMDRDPLIDIPRPQFRFARQLLPLWISALEQNREADLRQQAARTLVWAKRRGMQGLEKAIPALTAALADKRLVVRLASGLALAKIDAKASAAALAKASDADGLEMALVVEPALARWKVESRTSVWKKWLQDPLPESRQARLAMRCLAEYGDTSALARLVQLAADGNRRRTIRLAAADAIGAIATDGQLANAEQHLKGDSDAFSALLAAKMLRSHTSPEAQAVMRRLALHPEPTVAALGLEMLFHCNPDAIWPLAGQAIEQGDAKVRMLVAQAIVVRPKPERLTTLADLANDEHMGLRDYVGASLLKLSEDKALRETVLQQARRLFAQKDWRGKEQAILVLVKLDQKGIAPELVNLLIHPRPEVYVSAAWGIRVLAVDSTLPTALQVVQLRDRGAERQMLEGGLGGGFDEQIAQIFQFFGQKKYQPAGPLLRKYVPKSKGFILAKSRCAAIWSLGHLLAGKPDPRLAKELERRMQDSASTRPELDIVRQFAAVTLGRMKSEPSLPAIRKIQKEDGIGNPTGYAAYWAEKQINGKDFEKPQQTVRYYFGFFLEPSAYEAPDGE